MKRILVEYKVKADLVDENKNFIAKVFKRLQNDSPKGLKYASFIKEDGVSFVHIASIETLDGSNPLSVLDEFKNFTKDIKERCEVPPVAVELNEVGNYQLF